MKKKFSTQLPEAGQLIDLYARGGKKPLLRSVEFVPKANMTGAVRFRGNTVLYVTPSEVWTPAK